MARQDIHYAVMQVEGQIAGCDELAQWLEGKSRLELDGGKAKKLLDERDAVLELQTQYRELLRRAQR